MAGLLLSLTPCVYPMIPITAAVVAGAVARPGREGGEAGAAGRAFLASLIYVLGLSLVYALLGLASASLGGVRALWHPADCVGDLRAAGPALHLVLACRALREGYAPSRSCVMFAGDDGGERAACLVRAAA